MEDGERRTVFEKHAACVRDELSGYLEELTARDPSGFAPHSTFGRNLRAIQPSLLRTP
jgi:hypothetical protein